jgi:hypothetical protein
MPQVTLYLDEETETRMKAAAQAAGVSQSKWVAELIREKSATEWPASFARLIGAWADRDFPTLAEIRGTEVPDALREPF